MANVLPMIAAAFLPSAGAAAGLTAGEAIAAGIATGVAGAAVGKLLGKTPAAPKPTLMPDPENQDAARKKALTELITRSGRQSTILTDTNPTQKLGG